MLTTYVLLYYLVCKREGDREEGGKTGRGDREGGGTGGKGDREEGGEGGNGGRETGGKGEGGRGEGRQGGRGKGRKGDRGEGGQGGRGTEGKRDRGEGGQGEGGQGGRGTGGRGTGGGHVTICWCWTRSPFIGSAVGGRSSRSVGACCLQALVVHEWGASLSVEGLLLSAKGSFSSVVGSRCRSCALEPVVGAHSALWFEGGGGGCLLP
jgi:hypothetical protein